MPLASRPAQRRQVRMHDLLSTMYRNKNGSQGVQPRRIAIPFALRHLLKMTCCRIEAYGDVGLQLIRRIIVGLVAPGSVIVFRKTLLDNRLYGLSLLPLPLPLSLLVSFAFRWRYLLLAMLADWFQKTAQAPVSSLRFRSSIQSS